MLKKYYIIIHSKTLGLRKELNARISSPIKLMKINISCDKRLTQKRSCARLNVDLSLRTIEYEEQKSRVNISAT
jgi:hypothetical protein